MAVSVDNTRILLSEIRNEFDVTGPVKLGDFVHKRSIRGAGVTGLPSSGKIYARNLRGRTKFDTFNPKLWLRAEELDHLGHGADVLSWPGASASGSPNATSDRAGTSGWPTMMRSREPIPFVRFGTGVASTTNGNFMNFGSQAFNSLTNGGFTAVFMCRFSRDAGSNERVFDFGNGQANDNILFTRFESNTTARFQYIIGTTNTSVVMNNDVLSGGWQTFAVRVQNNELSMFNATPTTTSFTFNLTNRTVSNTYIAKSAWADAYYANLDLAEFMVWDKALSDSQINSIRDYLMNKYPLVPLTTNITWPSLFLVSRPRGSWNYVPTGTSPNIEWQLGSSAAVDNVNLAYRSTTPVKLQTTSGFYCHFELKVDGSADTLFFFAGLNTISANNTEYELANVGGGYTVTFNIYSASSTFGQISTCLVYNRTVLARGSFAVSGAWQPVEIVYSNSTTNTWKISWNGTTVIDYSDPNNSNFVASAGSFWGFGAHTGGATGNFYIRRVNMYHMGYTNVDLPVSSGLIGYYTGESHSGTTWNDLSGSNNHATCANVVSNAVVINGYKACSGGTNATVTWPAGILPPTYTLFHVTRYNGAAKNRIFTSNYNINWLSGFHGGKTGVSYHGDTTQWVTSHVNQFAYDAWILSTDQNALYRGNKISFTINTAFGASSRMGINYIPGELSDWTCAAVIVFNRTLSSYEIETMENWLARKYNIVNVQNPLTLTGLAHQSGVSGTGVGASMPFLGYGSSGAINATFRIASAFGNIVSEPSSTTLSVVSNAYKAPQILASFSAPVTGEFMLQRLDAGSGSYVNVGRKRVKNTTNILFNYHEVGDTFNDTGLLPHPPGPLVTNLNTPPTRGSSITLSGYAYGNGIYSVNASSEFGNTSIDFAFSAFDRNLASTTSAYAWSTLTASYAASTGNYTGTPTNYATTIDGSSYNGEWLQITLPTAIQLRSYRIYTHVSNRGPKTFKLAASSDGTTWVSLDTRTNQTSWLFTNNADTNGYNTFHIPVVPPAYRFYRICINQVNNSSAGAEYASIKELILYSDSGYTEQGRTIILDSTISTRISGSTWSSSLLGGQNATLINSPTYTAGYFSLNGTNQYITIPSVSGVTDFTNTSRYTVGFAVWISSTQTNNDKSLLEKWNTTNVPYPYVFRYVNNSIAASRSINMAIYDGTNGAGTSCPLPDTTFLNTWIFIVGTFDHVDKVMRFYINGIERASSSGYNLGSLSNSELVYLGTRGTQLSFCINARFKHFGIWNRVLTASEIMSLNSLLL